MNETTTPEETPFADMPLLNLDEKGAPPKARLTKASTLRNIFSTQRDDDRLSAMQRAQTQDLRDGGTPYEQSELDEQGMSDTTNLNFGGGEQQSERANTPYYRLFSAPETLVSVSTLHGADEDRADYNRIIDEELTLLLRNSESIPFQTKKIIDKMNWDGVGIGYWQDDFDWRYRGSGLGHFYFDRQCDTCEEDLECPTAFEEFTVTRLWRAIESQQGKKKKKGDMDGWNYKACVEAIKKATSQSSTDSDWDKLLDEIKNNDLGAAKGVKIPLVHGWVKEFDGTVSHYITTEENQGTEEFLYRSRGKYDEMQHALILFPTGIGTNTKLHSVRGQGYKIYAFETQRNRSLSKLIDQGDRASSLMVRASSESGMANIGLQYYGDLAVLPPETDVVPYVAPDLQRTVMPVLQEMERLRNDRVAGYSTDNVFDGGGRKTAKEITAHLDQAAELSDSQLDFFYGPFERLIRNTVIRISRRGYIAQDPGGREIVKFHKRLLRRGCPLEALYELDHDATTVVRAIGAGSAASKTQSLFRIGELRGRMDDVGQANLDRDLAVDAVGATNADRYFAKDGVKRTTLDTNIAILENEVLLAGKEIPVLPSDKHLAHAREHLKPLMEGYEMAQSGEVPYEEVAQRDALLFNHCSDHVELASGDPTVEAEAADMRQMLQQIGEVISNGLKIIESQRQDAEENGEGEQPVDDGGANAEMLAKVETNREELRMKREAFELDQRMKDEANAAQIAREDAKAAAGIRRTAKTKPRA